MKPDVIHAFPLAWDRDQTKRGGMMLRDFFAAMAMQALLGTLQGPGLDAYLSRNSKEKIPADLAERERTS